MFKVFRRLWRGIGRSRRLELFRRNVDDMKNVLRADFGPETPDFGHKEGRL